MHCCTQQCFASPHCKHCALLCSNGLHLLTDSDGRLAARSLSVASGSTSQLHLGQFSPAGPSLLVVDDGHAGPAENDGPYEPYDHDDPYDHDGHDTHMASGSTSASFHLLDPPSLLVMDDGHTGPGENDGPYDPYDPDDPDDPDDHDGHEDQWHQAPS